MVAQLSERRDVVWDATALGEALDVHRTFAFLRLPLLYALLISREITGVRQWAQFNAGRWFAAGTITETRACRLGEGTRRWEMLLTHTHFNQVGPLRSLAFACDTPDSTEVREATFLPGESAYRNAVPVSGGGADTGDVLSCAVRSGQPSRRSVRRRLAEANRGGRTPASNEFGRSIT